MRQLSLMLIAILLAVAPAMGQSKDPRVKLRSMVKTAGSDVEALVAAARFATENGLVKDRDALIKKILKIDKDNAWANETLGRVLHEGKWVERKAYDALIAKKLEDKYRAEGLHAVNGVWVTKEHVDDAKRGVFHDGSQLVTRYEKQQLLMQRVRHPRTGRFIDAADLEKANAGQFPMAGQWVTLDQANKFHERTTNPWAIRSKYAIVITTEPLESIDRGEPSLTATIDQAAEKAMKIFGAKDAPPSRRPVIMLASSTEQFRDLGTNFGGPDTDCGVFFAGRQRVSIDGIENGQTVLNFAEKAWRPYFARHAVGYALSIAFAGSHADAVPAWFHRGVGTYLERYNDKAQAAFFGKQQAKRGGPKDLKRFFSEFEISAELSKDDVNSNLMTAGAVIAFSLEGGEASVTTAMVAVTRVFEKGADPVPAIRALEGVLQKNEPKLRTWFDQLVQ